ncbi:hypothetical protein SHAb15599_00111 [Acinetobacter phage SH-Ab 15599]|nr:hypothetical protein SHAb15599_00111 [Acinetobacter phage SH-Ab 15599]
MQLQQVDESVEVTGGTAINMTMNAESGIGFHLNISKLYTNKYESVIREICSNAKDSHVEAGKGHVPFEIFLPSELSPYLIIKDQGLGLNKEDAIKYLSQLYASSKQGSNAALGAYGIGAKSPFAISDSYNITTVKDGKKCSFQFFRSGRSLPQLMLLEECDTDEPNGVTFRIHVKDFQHQIYERALRTQMFMFTPKPIIDGQAWPYDEPVLEREKFNIKLYSRCNIQRDFFGPYVLEMGGVTYPFDPSQVDSSTREVFNAIKETIASDEILVISVPIGAVEVPGDRERVEYSEFTIESLKTELQTVVQSFTQDEIEEYMKNFNETEGMFDTLKVMKDFSNKIGRLSSFIIGSEKLEVSKTWNLCSKPYLAKEGMVQPSHTVTANKFKERIDDWYLPGPIYVRSIPQKKAILADDKETILGYEDEIKSFNVEKYKIGELLRASSGAVMSKYYEVVHINQNFLYSHNIRTHDAAIVFVDTESKPCVKTTDGWWAENPQYKTVMIIKDNSKTYDFADIKDILMTLDPGIESRFHMLSDMTYTKAKPQSIDGVPVERLVNAVGFRVVKGHPVVHSRSGYKDVKGMSNVVLEELNKYLFAEQKDAFAAYAFIDVNTNKLYYDPEHKLLIDNWETHFYLDLQKTGEYSKHAKLLLMSPSIAKKHLEHIKTLGTPSLYDIKIGAERLLVHNIRQPHRMTLLQNVLKYNYICRSRSVAKKFDFLAECMSTILGLNDPRDYSHSCKLEPYTLFKQIFERDSWSRGLISNANDEMREDWFWIHMIFLYADKNRFSYAYRMINHMFSNIQRDLLKEENEVDFKNAVESSKKNPRGLYDFFVNQMINKMDKHDRAKIMKDYSAYHADQEIDDFEYEN